jgi:hypothetical protein
MNIISKEYVGSRVSYDPCTGIFLWKSCRVSSKVGTIAGTKRNGYWVIELNGRQYMAHRLA